jgi:hypothetical protein
MILLLLLAVQATAGGCALFGGASPKVTRRYATHAFVHEDTPSVKITVFALPVPPAPPEETGLTDLGPQAQAELVKVMAERTRDGGARDVVQALALPIEGTSSAPSFRDLTRLSRRLVFSLDNQSWGPANRISQARIFVQPMQTARFLSWNRIENVYERLEVGRLSLSQGRSASAELGLTLPVLGAAPQVSGGAETTLSEEVTLSQQRVVLTGAMSPDSAMLLQQGGAGIDLTGNVTADFTFAVPAGEDTTVFIPLLSPLSGDSAADRAACEQRPDFARQTFRFALQSGAGPADVAFHIRLEYVLRDVPRGHSTLTESDDAVVFRTGRAMAQSVVVPGEALEFEVFQLQIRDTTLYIRGATQSGTATRQAPLEFGAFDDAVAMMRWMRGCTVAKVGRPVLLGRDGMQVPPGRENDIHIARVPMNYQGNGGEMPQRPAMSAPAAPNTTVAAGRGAH